MSITNKAGVYIIAEMSANHNHDINKALEIVYSAKNAGADCLKIQTYTADTMTIDSKNADFMIKGGLWDGYSLYDLYKEAYTPWEWQPRIKKECEKVGLDFLSTPFDRSSVDFLESMNVSMYKIASFEIVDIPLIRYIAGKGKPIILSCGMSSTDEINEAIEVMEDAGLTKDQIVLLKCTSAYPAIPSDMNLKTITDMKKRYGTLVGLSDHSIGDIAPVVATSLGAKVIEKHFCLSRKENGPDNAFSSEPDEFKKMVDSVRQAYQALGGVSYGTGQTEAENYKFRRSLYAIKDIAIGEVFSESNIKSIRPGYGVAPKYFDKLIGQKSKCNYSKGTPISDKEI